MITKNEGIFLERALNSVKGVVNEIIVVDTGSTDRTKEIARKYTDNIYDFTWCDDFSAARNESLKYANSDWILILDADEVIAQKDLEFLKELSNDAADSFLMTQRTYTNNNLFLNFVSSAKDPYLESRDFLGWTATKIIRLFKNRRGFFFSGRIHESVLPSIMKGKGIIKEVNLPIHHYSFEKTGGCLEHKRAFYQRLGELKLKDDPKDVDALYEMAKRMIMEKKFLEAKNALEEIKFINATFSKLYPLLIYTYAELNNVTKAEEAFALAKQYGGDMRSAVLGISIAYEKDKKYDLAIRKIHENGYGSTDFIPLLYVLGKCFFALGNYAIAFKYLQEVVGKDKTHPASKLLGESLLKLNEKSRNT